MEGSRDPKRINVGDVHAGPGGQAAHTIVNNINISTMGGGRRPLPGEPRGFLLLPLFFLVSSVLMGLPFWVPKTFSYEVVLVLLALGAGIKLSAVVFSAVTAPPGSVAEAMFFSCAVMSLLVSVIGFFNAPWVPGTMIGTTLAVVAWSTVAIIAWMFPRARVAEPSVKQEGLR